MNQLCAEVIRAVGSYTRSPGSQNALTAGDGCESPTCDGEDTRLVGGPGGVRLVLCDEHVAKLRGDSLR